MHYYYKKLVFNVDPLYLSPQNIVLWVYKNHAVYHMQYRNISIKPSSLHKHSTLAVREANIAEVSNKI